MHAHFPPAARKDEYPPLTETMCSGMIARACGNDWTQVQVNGQLNVKIFACDWISEKLAKWIWLCCSGSVQHGLKSRVILKWSVWTLLQDQSDPASEREKTWERESQSKETRIISFMIHQHEDCFQRWRDWISKKPYQQPSTANTTAATNVTHAHINQNRPEMKCCRQWGTLVPFSLPAFGLGTGPQS